MSIVKKQQVPQMQAALVSTKSWAGGLVSSSAWPSHANDLPHANNLPHANPLHNHQLSRDTEEKSRIQTKATKKGHNLKR